MNIIVCLKQVPGTTKVQINPETNTLIRENIENVTNPLDTYALEEGIRLRERFGGKVIAISMGPSPAQDMLREALSIGADDAILLSDRAFAGADTLATGFTLAMAVRKIKDVDLVICGRQTVDGDTGQVGPEMAVSIGFPFVGYVSKIEEVANGKMRLQRAIEEGHEEMETTLPAVISVAKEINVPRLPSFRGILKAKKAVIPIWTVADLGVDKNDVGLAGSATKVIKVFFPQHTHHAEMIQGEPSQQVETLIEKLKEAKIL